MFKEVRQYIFPVVISAIMLSCGGHSEDGQIINQDSIKAEGMLKDANDAFQNGEHERALLIIDEIDSVYAKQVTVRRKAMVLRPKLKESIIMNEIIATDSMIAYGLEKNESINKLNKLRIKKEKLERQLQVARNQQVRSEQ